MGAFSKGPQIRPKTSRTEPDELGWPRADYALKPLVFLVFLDDIGCGWRINWRPVRESNPCRLREREVS